jgi:hypothetical protein
MRPPKSLLIRCRTGLAIWRDSKFREMRQYQDVGQRRKMGKNGTDFKALVPIAAILSFRTKS